MRPTPPALEADTPRLVAIGTGIWLVAFVVGLARGDGTWMWTCAVGMLLGVLGVVQSRKVARRAGTRR